MKLKLLVLFFMLSFMEIKAQEGLQTLFEDDFEAYDSFAIADIGQWTLREVNNLRTFGFRDIAFPNMGLRFAYVVFNSKETTPSIDGGPWDAHSGEKAMIAFASIPEGYLGNNDWLISPKIRLLDYQNKVSFYAKSATVEYGADRFKVGVSTTDTEVASFTVISQGTFVETTDYWTEYSYDLSAYAGQDIYISINCVSFDTFGFMVDDFKVVGSNNASINKALASQFTVFPNPTKDIVNFVNTRNILVSKVEVLDLNGRIVQSFDFDLVESSEVNISQLQAGVYFLNITTNEGLVTKKIIKK